MDVQSIPFLSEVVPLDPSSSIQEHKVRRLTAAGENYGSLMLSVDITVKSPEGTREINAVAKMVPPNEYIQKVFNTQVTFRNEIAFYREIVPTLRRFQQEQGMANAIDFFPKYLGSRLNRDNSDRVDSDGILLLENLKMAGYANLERTVGFDLEVAKVVVKDLAHLHAVPLGLKLQKPDVFEKKVKKYLSPFHPDDDEKIVEKMCNLVCSLDTCQKYHERAKSALWKMRDRNTTIREPFATLVHDDCWVNNTMVKIQPGEVPKNKFVDFQICNYGSPAKDLLFLLFSSVQNDVIRSECDNLIRLYHGTFVDVLRQLKCDTEPFSFEKFEQEIKFEALNTQFGHVVFMLTPIFAPKGSVKELDEFSPEAFAEMVGSFASDLHKEKLALVVNEFGKRNWI
ncbi:uncharacterized protein LOC655368 [Tribolium castaneum]|uniref:CHK kinase-like domain-containing protein n=1 Tax=Tribolium castaneum TaxID=7070 RepID=D2A4Z9_TRICA|nr:PREDICTED: uncharacterized protein LOC655368 [Tribolium castaneum]EFA05154.1 hypothetical protein TcasGA2_TC015272 [Tribolium castaneum]|eukprot:XP_967001.1 PREDICTED: uncharacterized protein LOC655368 [Tribolium castaneum]